MIEVGIPKDIREFEPTLVATFTTRQVICGVGMAAVVYFVYFLEKAAGIENPMESMGAMVLFLIPAIPFVLVGWVKPCGMHFEKFFWRALCDNVICPTSRKYAVNNYWDVIEQDELQELKKNPEIAKEIAKIEAKKKKHVEPARSSLPQELRPYKERFPARHKKTVAKQTYLFS